MINPNTMKALFKPYHIPTLSLPSLFEVFGLSEREWFKIMFEDECSKATDESCINIQCPYNYLEMHQDELYIDLMQEIQAKRKELKIRQKEIKKNMVIYDCGGD